MDIGNLISGSSAFSKPSLYIWKFLVHVPLKPSLKVLSITLLACESEVAQSCPTLFDHMDYTVHGILQAKILEWVAIPFSRGSSQPRDQTQESHIAGGFFTS